MGTYEKLQAVISHLREQGITVEGVEGRPSTGWPYVADLRLASGSKADDAEQILGMGGIPELAHHARTGPWHVRIHLSR